MKPAFSVIFFTSAAGAGYGLLFLLGLAVPFGWLPPDRFLAGLGLTLALVLISAGLLSSALHLGRPDRAWRAFSQWRSSWLSREGVLALATYIPATLTFLGWVLLGNFGGLFALTAILSALGALATVYSTGMIYASLKTIGEWHNPWVVPLYLAFALASGSLWLLAVLSLGGAFPKDFYLLAGAALLLAWGMKLAYWASVLKWDAIATPESATGLGDFGLVRLLESPHTEKNYLLTEMGFRIGRKHRTKLRAIAMAFGYALPFFLIALGWALGARDTLSWLVIPICFLSALSGSLGILVERWLFFAEARHSVTLYYGQRL